ncbi:MAG: IscA/HesB family protein [Deltaproteobacteria bacterium]
MLELTGIAAEKIRDYCEQNNVNSPIRVVAMNGCGGPSLGLALGDRGEEDATVTTEGIEVIIDKELLQVVESVKVDFIEPTGSGCGCGGGGGFAVTSTKPLPGSGGGCGGSCSSGCAC